MPESRGESFYGGRFFERHFGADPHEPSEHSSKNWDYEVAFRASDKEGSPAAYVSTRYTPDMYYGTMRHHDSFNHDGQGVLFQALPERHEIDEAYSTKDARHHIPTLLGMAAQHSLQQRGRLPRASADLSVHSNQLVNKFADLGIIESPAQRGKEQPLNSIGWEAGADSAQWRSQNTKYAGDEVPFERVNAGRQFVRDALRRPRKYQAEQLTID